jgi:hypothetical protein
VPNHCRAAYHPSLRQQFNLAKPIGFAMPLLLLGTLSKTEANVHQKEEAIARDLSWLIYFLGILWRVFGLR